MRGLLIKGPCHLAEHTARPRRVYWKGKKWRYTYPYILNFLTSPGNWICVTYFCDEASFLPQGCGIACEPVCSVGQRYICFGACHCPQLESQVNCWVWDYSMSGRLSFRKIVAHVNLKKELVNISVEPKVKHSSWLLSVKQWAPRIWNDLQRYKTLTHANCPVEEKVMTAIPE